MINELNTFFHVLNEFFKNIKRSLEKQKTNKIPRFSKYSVQTKKDCFIKIFLNGFLKQQNSKQAYGVQLWKVKCNTTSPAQTSPLNCCNESAFYCEIKQRGEKLSRVCCWQRDRHFTQQFIHHDSCTAVLVHLQTEESEGRIWKHDTTSNVGLRASGHQRCCFCWAAGQNLLRFLLQVFRNNLKVAYCCL